MQSYHPIPHQTTSFIPHCVDQHAEMSQRETTDSFSVRKLSEGTSDDYGDAITSWQLEPTSC